MCRPENKHFLEDNLEYLGCQIVQRQTHPPPSHPVHHWGGGGGGGRLLSLWMIESKEGPQLVPHDAKTRQSLGQLKLILCMIIYIQEIFAKGKVFSELDTFTLTFDFSLSLPAENSTSESCKTILKLDCIYNCLIYLGPTGIPFAV